MCGAESASENVCYPQSAAANGGPPMVVHQQWRSDRGIAGRFGLLRGLERILGDFCCRRRQSKFDGGIDLAQSRSEHRGC